MTYRRRLIALVTACAVLVQAPLAFAMSCGPHGEDHVSAGEVAVAARMDVGETGDCHEMSPAGHTSAGYTSAGHTSAGHTSAGHNATDATGEACCDSGCACPVMKAGMLPAPVQTGLEDRPTVIVTELISRPELPVGRILHPPIS